MSGLKAVVFVMIFTVLMLNTGSALAYQKSTNCLVYSACSTQHYDTDQYNCSYSQVCWQPPNQGNFPYGCPPNCSQQSENTKQYYVQLSFNPDNSVTCPPSHCTTELWYNPGQTATFSVVPIVPVNQSMRYQFVGWSGDYAGTNANGTLVMNSDEQVTANYDMQYLLTVNVSNQTSSSWNNAGTSVPVNAQSDIPTGDGARLLFVTWIEDNNTIANSSNQLSVTMDAPHSLVAQFQQQYYVSVSSQVPTPSIVGQGWYDAGTQATISVATPPDPSYGTSYVFQSWQGSSASLNAGSPESQNMTITVNQPIDAMAVWRTDSTVLYETIGAIVAVIAALCLAVALKPKLSNRRKQATLSPFAKSPPSETSEELKVSSITPSETHNEIKESNQGFCISCGKVLPEEGAKFCNKCGTEQP